MMWVIQTGRSSGLRFILGVAFPIRLDQWHLDPSSTLTVAGPRGIHPTSHFKPLQAPLDIIEF